MVNQKLLANGYPQSLIQRAVNQVRCKVHRKSSNRQNPIYVKVPFVNDRSARELNRAARQSGLPIRLTFSRSPPLASLLRKNGPLPCPRNCVCNNRNLCMKKNIVYQVKCSLCAATYIGETYRTLGRRVQEHATTRSSLVYRHFQTQHPLSPISLNIEVAILEGSCLDTMHRRAIEERLIRERDPIMNIQNRS